MATNANVTTDAVKQMIANSRGVGNANQSKFNEKDYLNTKLKEGEASRKINVRILPVNEEDSNFAIKLKTHSLKVDPKISKSGFKSFTCLNDRQIPNYDPNVKCPLCKKSYELFTKGKELNEKGELKMAEPLLSKAKELMNKNTYIVRVIERGKEDEGVKFWRFNENFKGQGVFDKLVNIFENKMESYKEDGKGDNYNVFDLTNGRDFIVTIKREFDKSGNESTPSINIDTKDSESPLTTDLELFNKWVADPKRWYNAYAVRTPDYLSIIAEGEIPVKSADGNSWIAESVRESENLKKKEENENIRKESEKILENTESTTASQPSVEQQEDDDELPF